MSTFRVGVRLHIACWFPVLQPWWCLTHTLLLVPGRFADMSRLLKGLGVVEVAPTGLPPT